MKSNEFFKAIDVALKLDSKDFIFSISKGVHLAYNLKLNDILKRMKEYQDKLVWLKVVQHNKSSMPGLAFGGGQQDFETMS